jgi:hypothetical protein
MANPDESGHPQPKRAHRAWEVALAAVVAGVVVILTMAPKSAWPAVVPLAIAAVVCGLMAILTTRRGRRELLDVTDDGS